MHYQELPRLCADAVSSLRNAKQDKIELTIGSWEFNGNTEQARSFAEHLSHEAIFLRDERGIRQRHYLFRRPRGQNGQSPSVPLRLLSLHTGGVGHPIIQGVVHIRRSGDGTAYYRIEAKLSINPTRMLAIMPPRDVVFADLDNGEPIEPRFTRMQRFQPLADEFPLRLADNYIANRRVLRRMVGERWRTFVEERLHFLDARLHRLFTSAAEHIGITLHRRRIFNLQLVETYWEYQHPDPLFFMHQAEPAFRSLGRAGRLTDYDISAVAELLPRSRSDYNSPCFKIDLSSEATLKIYAKTNRRVRFEVMRESGRTPHQHNSLSDIADLIFQFAEEASGQVSHAIQNLFETVEPTGPQHPPHALLMAILGATDDVAEQHVLASALILNGLYEKVPGQPINNAVDVLKRRGVIQSTARGRRTYRLANEYLQARNALRQLHGGFLPSQTSPSA